MWWWACEIIDCYVLRVFTEGWGLRTRLSVGKEGGREGAILASG